MSDQAERVFFFASRLAAQCERLGVEHGIAPAPPGSIIESSMMESQAREAVRKLSLMTGINPQNGDFLGLVELYGASRGRVAYWQS